MGLTLTTFDAAMKVLYPNGKVQNMVYETNPYLAMIAKDEKFYGDSMQVPIVHGDPQGGSQSFTEAQTGADDTSTSISAFLLTRVHDYGVCNIDNEAMEASESNVGAFLSAKKAEIDGTLNNVGRSAAISLFREGYGARGVIAVGGRSGSTITLATIKDITNFEKGMKIVFAASLASDALRDSADYLIISGVNRVTGVITFTAAVSGISGLADGDYLFRRGDREDSASPARKMLAGLGAYLPATAPSASESFFGVDRSVDTRLGGLRQSSNGAPVDEALQDAASLCAQEGGKPDLVLMNYANWTNLAKRLAGDLVRSDVKATQQIGFPGIRVEGPAGVMDVVSDRNCPSDTIFMLQSSTWKLWSLGGVPKFIGGDNLKMLRQASADGVQARIGYYAQVACTAPGFNCRITI